jgi:hypothetical protein
MMIRPVSPTRPARPVEALRQSSDQIRQAADVLADLIADTVDLDAEVPAAARIPARSAAAEETILKAQRSFVEGLRLPQSADGSREPDGR